MFGISLDVIVKNRVIKKYKQPNTVKEFIEGRKGTDYTLRIHNSKFNKVKVVISVDGLNVMTGEPNWERGYEIGAYSYLDVPGWRINSDKIAKFIFGSKGDAYNQESAHNAGVIGVLAFDEVEQMKPIPMVQHHYHWNRYPYNGWYQYPYTTHFTLTGGVSTLNANNIGGALGGGNVSYTATNAVGGCGMSSSCGAPIADVAMASAGEPEQLATGWGDEQSFQTVTVDTKYKANHFGKLTLYYDEAKGLAKRGIIVGSDEQVVEPNPFPNLNDFGCVPPSKKI